MRIILDNLIFSVEKAGGISTVWGEHLKNLVTQERSDVTLLESKNPISDLRNSIDCDFKRIEITDKMKQFKKFLPIAINSESPFIFHTPIYRYCKSKNAVNVITVHDFTYEYYITGLKKHFHCYFLYNSIQRGNYVVCISNNTKKDLLKFVPQIDESRIRVIYNGVSEDYHPIVGGELRDIPFESKSFLIYVGARHSYKNYDFLIRNLSKTPYNLVVVGKPLSEAEWNYLERYIPKERVFSTGYVDNASLNLLYNHAAALVYPSSYEGFGIPVVEAQKAGCPVVSLNASSIPEIIGETPLLMEELTEKDFLAKINLLSNQKIVEELVSAGIDNANRFSWKRMTEEYCSLYDEISAKY